MWGLTRVVFVTNYRNGRGLYNLLCTSKPFWILPCNHVSVNNTISYTVYEARLLLLELESLEACRLKQWFSNWGPRNKGGPRRVPTGSARRFRKVVIVCTVFNNLRPICFQICTHKSVTQSQCIAWKCCRMVWHDRLSVDVS